MATDLSNVFDCSSTIEKVGSMRYVKSTDENLADQLRIKAEQMLYGETLKT